MVSASAIIMQTLICANVLVVAFFFNTLPLLCPQFAAWVDAVVFVFSLEDEISFQTVYNYFLRLSSYRNTAEVPMVLVGTQGACPASDMYIQMFFIVSYIMKL